MVTTRFVAFRLIMAGLVQRSARKSRAAIASTAAQPRLPVAPETAIVYDMLIPPFRL